MLIIQELLGYVLLGGMAAAALAVCYLPLYFLLRRRFPLGRQLPCFLLGVCLLVVCMATFGERVLSCLLAGQPLLAAQRSLNLVPLRFLTESWDMGPRKQLTQALANVLMFLPLGVLLPAALRPLRRFGRTAGLLALFSLAIEAIQYPIGRTADIDDLLLNSLGGMLGYLLFALWGRLRGGK